MSLTVRQYAGSDEQTWDAFVATSRNGTVFHTRRFLAYHPEGRFEDHSLLIHDDQKLVALLPAAVKDGALVSHPGASYGGLVLASDVSVTDTGVILDAVLNHAKEAGLSGLSMLRLPPVSLHKEFSEDQQYWMFQKGFTLTRTEMDGAIDLCGMTEDDVLPSLTGKCRNMVRQAERAEIRTKLTSDFASFWPILESVLSGRHGTKPTHTLEEIVRLNELLPDAFRLLAAYKGNVMVGGIVLVTINQRALYTLYMAQEYSSQKDHPMHALLADAMRLAIKEHRGILHLGVSTEDGGKKVNEGLFFFKESFGCRPVRRESWERKTAS